MDTKVKQKQKLALFAVCGEAVNVGLLSFVAL